ncbi:MAG: hypothetical protein ACOCYY_02420, partial [Desulfohalobiaceae bacterium]
SDYDYDHDNDSEGRAEQIAIMVVVVIAVDTHDINLTAGQWPPAVALFAESCCWRCSVPY